MLVRPGYLSAEAAYWTEVPPPPQVQPTWSQLQVARALFSFALTAVASEPDYLTRRNSPLLLDRMATTTLESCAASVFDLLLNLTREMILAFTLTPVRRRKLNALSASGILDVARESRLLTPAACSALEQVRLIGVLRTAQDSSGYTWRQIHLLQTETEGIMAELQADFARVGVHLPIDWH